MLRIECRCGILLRARPCSARDPFVATRVRSRGRTARAVGGWRGGITASEGARARVSGGASPAVQRSHFDLKIGP